MKNITNMYLNRIILSFSLFAILAIPSFSQDSITFKPSGKVIAQSFFDYSAGFGKSNTRPTLLQGNAKSGFNLTRAYLGYNYQITPELRAQIVVDGAAGTTSGAKYEVNIKNAFLEWTRGNFSTSIGMIGLTQFNTQEKYWQHRYVEKAFQDRVKMSPSADLGIKVAYKLRPSVSVDGSIINGEGYKNASLNNSNKYTLGLNLFPLENFIVRGFVSTYSVADNVKTSIDDDYNVTYINENAFSIFVGYQNKKLSAGVEFAETFNRGFIKERNFYGYSAFASYKVSPKLDIFGRYDYLDSTNPPSYTIQWSESDGHLLMGGIGYIPMKQIKISPNVRISKLSGDKTLPYIFVNFEFNL